jgi:hypothetical protein
MSQALFVLVVVRWQCVKAVGGVDIHVVYLINISRIKKKKKEKTLPVARHVLSPFCHCWVLW